jgi:hypothetical protein
MLIAPTVVMADGDQNAAGQRWLSNDEPFVIELREPLDGPWREFAANPGYDQTASHPNSN